MEISEHIQGILDNLPPKPGCYMMKDDGGDVIYVGKAINLRSRVRSYYHASVKHVSKNSQMVRRISDIEWIIVDSELEALILENNLIKALKPRYNILLRDDKRYPYIFVSTEHKSPLLRYLRGGRREKGRHLGPYPGAGRVR